MTYEDCPDRIALFAWDRPEPVRYACGCRECPPPDPTPSWLQSAIDQEWIAFNLGLAQR